MSARRHIALLPFSQPIVGVSRPIAISTVGLPRRQSGLRLSTIAGTPLLAIATVVRRRRRRSEKEVLVTSFVVQQVVSPAIIPGCGAVARRIADGRSPPYCYAFSQ